MNARDESESEHNRTLSDFRAIEMSNNSSSIMRGLLIPESGLILCVCGGGWNWGSDGKKRMLTQSLSSPGSPPHGAARLSTRGIKETHTNSPVNSKSSGH